MDPLTLAKVLHLPESDPALLDGPQNHEVYGMAYEVGSQEHLDRLIAYETDKYKPKACLIEFLDGGDREVAWRA